MNAPDPTLARSVRDQVSPEEWQTRVDLAACYRLMALHGMTEMIANHISMRVPGTENEFLLNPYGMLYDEMTASSMIRIDVDGNVLFNASGYGINKAGYVIHSAIHKARHDVGCIIHTHTLAGMSVSAMKVGLMPIAQSSMRFADVAYHDYEGIALRLESLGEQDLTCHVLWDRIEPVMVAAGFRDVRLDRQEAFFVKHAAGEMERIAMSGDHEATGRLRALTHPAHFGAKFQVLHGIRG